MPTERCPRCGGALIMHQWSQRGDAHTMETCIESLALRLVQLEVQLRMATPEYHNEWGSSKFTDGVDN